MNCFRKCLLFTLLIAGMLGAQTANGQNQFAGLAKWIPNDANVIVIVEAKKILDSELAKKEGWKKKRRAAFNSGAANLPTTTQQMMTASRMDIQFMEPKWTVSIFSNARDLDIGIISKRSGGNIDSIAGHNAIELSNDSYIVQLDARTLAAMSPANRQDTSRWLRTKQGRPIGLSPYLKQAISFTQKNADVVMALDMTDSLNHDRIHARLEAGGIVEPENLEAVCTTLCTIKGITLGITVRDKIFGSIKIDFNSDASALKAKAKDMFMAVLADHGLMIDDFDSWNWEQKSNQITLSGPMTGTGLRQILGLVRDPIHSDARFDEGGDVAEISVATRTQQYFSSIQVLFEEMRKQKTKRLTTYAGWFERNAREIDQMSILNVDEDMVQYGQYVAESLRRAALGMRDSDLDAIAATSKMADSRSFSTGVGYSYGGYGYGGYGGRSGRYGGYAYYDNRKNDRRAARTEANSQGEKDARAILNEVTSETAKIRVDMTQKYEVNF